MTNLTDKPLKVLIVDDEHPARKRLKKLLQPLISERRIELVAEAPDGRAALDLLQETPIDLMFLDIQMPELDGFDVLEKVEQANRPYVVFTTAYDAYALRAFEANAVDYLLKPVAKERLFESIQRVEKTFNKTREVPGQQKRLQQLLTWLESDHSSDPPQIKKQDYLRQISVPHRNKILIVPVERIISAEITEGITRLNIREGESPTTSIQIRQHVVNYTLDQLETSLSPQDFMRVHRSAIVQISQIREMISWFSGRYKLVLTGNIEVVASRERSKQLKGLMML